MAIVVPNYCRTTLRVAITPASTQLLLASGGSACLNIGTGNYVFLTIEDGSSVEVVKFTNSGLIVNDTITVQRGQDGTTAKSFPAGACVKVAWDYQQVQDLITQTFNDLFDAGVIPPNTAQVNSTPNAAPVDPHVIYAINLATRQFWYWSGSSWYEIGNPRDGVLAGTTDPVGAPSNTTAFFVNTTTGTLFYWTGSGWLPVSGGGGAVGGPTEEYWVRGALGGTLYTLVSNSQVALGNIALSDFYRVFPNGIAANTIMQSIIQVGLPRVTLTQAAVMNINLSIHGDFGANPVPNAIMELVISNNVNTALFGNSSSVAPGFQPAIVMSASTGTLQWPSGTYFDGNLIYTQTGAGPWDNFILRQVIAEFHIIQAA